MRISDWSSDVCSSDLPKASDDRVFVTAFSVSVEMAGKTCAGAASAAATCVGGDVVAAQAESRPSAAMKAGKRINKVSESICRLEALSNHIPFGRFLAACRGLGVFHAAEIALQCRHEILVRSDEHTSELQSLMRTSSAVFCFN